MDSYHTVTPDKSMGTPRPAAPVIDALTEAVGRLRYGTVQLTIHDGRVVQLDVTERKRFG
jgi:hypothetical protein